MTSQEFDTLYRRNYATLYRLAFSLLHDDDDSRDVVNEVFTELLDSGKADEVDNVDGYLFRAVRNRALSYIEKQDMRQRVSRLYPIEVEISVGYDHEYDRKLCLVKQFLDSNLTPDARFAMKLVFEQGKSYKEAAGQMGVSVSMINKHVVKTLRLMREQLKVEIEN